jgi:TIR domain
MHQSTSPTAFICHATEDKKRFAEPFAVALCKKGVDAWLDSWEVLLGDSLPQKIFGALAQAKFVIAVLSPYSIRKPWVAAELDLAVVRRIEGETRIIPINLGLERHEIPPALQAIRWVSVADPDNFQAALDEVLDAIFQRSRKPSLGPAAGFTDVKRIGCPEVPSACSAPVLP